MSLKLPFPINNNTIALSFVTIITVLFLVAGAFDVLDYIIFKIIIIGLTVIIAIVVCVILFKKDLIKNRPEDNLQDDFN